jgi:hypothetical protein
MTNIEERTIGAPPLVADASGAVVAPSRRSLLVGGVGALAAFAASALGRPREAQATNGQAILLGRSPADAIDGLGTNEASATTMVVTTAGAGFWAQGPDGGLIGTSNAHYGAYGESQSSFGVWGRSDSLYGVFGVSDSSYGVYGTSDSTYGVYGTSGTSEGVHGACNATSGIGVHGSSNGSDGIGVHGSSNGSAGIGVKGSGLGSAGTGVVGSGRVGVFATSTAPGWMGIWGRHFGAGYGVAGDSALHIGVSGASDASNQPGILATSRGNSTGLLGFSGGTSSTPPAAAAKTGVFGQASQDSSSRGVWGKTTTGQGVRGDASTGVGMYGAASNKAGYAFRGSGRIRFDKVSGVASIPAGATSVTITPGTDITAESFVLLTPKSNIGTRSLYFTTDATNDTITIRMSSSAATATSIGWLLLR